MTDPIADLLTRIKNAYLAKHQSLIVPHSRLKEALVKILINNHYLKGLKIEGKRPFLNLNIDLKYINRQPALTNVRRISRPGVRHYADVAKLDRLIKGRGVTLLSTSKGIMTVAEARKLSVGGEIICKIS
ncbi:MAG: 30S ribosomal protein S8 [Candidatus Beckwithbacteria bacterium]|nr:30S ribosomal protein S8 [Candidatus Beckwithbacteria bacterium]